MFSSIKLPFLTSRLLGAALGLCFVASPMLADGNNYRRDRDKDKDKSPRFKITRKVLKRDYKDKDRCVPSVPEPISVASSLLAAGLIGAGAWAMRRRNQG